MTHHLCHSRSFTALMHLFYARFFGYFLHEQGLLPQPEPFHQLLTQGFVQGQSFRDKVTGKYLTADEVDLSGKLFGRRKGVDKIIWDLRSLSVVGSVPKGKDSGNEVITEWEKMSKSKMNGLNPDVSFAFAFFLTSVHDCYACRMP